MGLFGNQWGLAIDKSAKDAVILLSHSSVALVLGYLAVQDI